MSAARTVRVRARRADGSAAGARSFAVACSIAIASLVIAQYAAPAWSGFHTWQYAAIVALALGGVLTYPWKLREGGDGIFGVPLGIAMAGASIVAITGLACGLLAPDAQTLSRAPGAVAPLPDANAAAFFPNVDPASVAQGDDAIVVRRRRGNAVNLALGQVRFIGGDALRAVPRAAAYVEARDLRGEHLTITQPANSAFLSPLLQFPQSVQIAGQTIPSDEFATPAARRLVKAFYFSGDATAKAAVRRFAGEPAVLFAVNDDGGKLLRGAIGFATSGEEIALGGLRLRPTIGAYPALEVSPVPLPVPLGVGMAALLGGLAAAAGAAIRARRHIPAQEGKSPAFVKGAPSCPD